jgi:uncharacterized membrane protein
MIKLLGIALVAVGFAFRVNTLLVVVAAGILTGLLAGLSFHEVMRLIGEAFVANRFMVLPIVLMVPVVGLLERHGLQVRVAMLIRRASAATAGRVLWLYQVVREGTSMLGLSIGNHASMVRPLVVPLAEGAATVNSASPLEAKNTSTIRAHAAASENIGNFFADDLLVAVGALLLIKGFFDIVGVEVSLRDIKLWSVPTAGWVLIVGWWRFRALDQNLAKQRKHPS